MFQSGSFDWKTTSTFVARTPKIDTAIKLILSEVSREHYQKNELHRTALALCQAPKRQPLRTLAEERLGEVKRGHHVDLARRWNETFEGRHRAGNRSLAQEAHQADHRQASIVNFRLQLLRLPLVALVLVEAERIIQVQRHRVRQKRKALRVLENPNPGLSFHALGQIERREEARLSTPHVVTSLPWALRHRSFGVELEEADGEENLPFGLRGDVLPERWGAHAGCAQFVAGHLPGEVNAVRVDAVPDEPGHCDASVLDLGVTQEADGRFVGLVPELPFSEVQGVPKSDDRVEPFRQSLQIRRRLNRGDNVVLSANCESCNR